MASVGEGFVDKLRSFASIPENEVTNYEIYDDLTFKKNKGLSVKVESCALPQLSKDEREEQKCDQVSKILSTITGEIKRNNFSLLKDINVQSYLPPVLQNLSKYSSHLSNGAINQTRSLIYAYLPLITKEGTPCVDVDLTKPFQMVKGQKVGNDEDTSSALQTLYKELPSPEQIIPDTLTLELLTRIIAYEIHREGERVVRYRLKTHMCAIVFLIFNGQTVSKEQDEFLKMHLSFVCESTDFFFNKIKEITNDKLSTLDEKSLKYKEFFDAFILLKRFTKGYDLSFALEHDLRSLSSYFLSTVFEDLKLFYGNHRMKEILLNIYNEIKSSDVQVKDVASADSSNRLLMYLVAKSLLSIGIVQVCAPLKIAESDFLTLLNYYEPQQGHILYTGMFPLMTLGGLNLLLKNSPRIDLKDFDPSKDSNLCDVVLFDGENGYLYMNKAILSRSSEYFKVLFSFKEGENATPPMMEKLTIQIGKEEFNLLQTWMPVILQLFDNPFFGKVDKFKANLKQYIADLNLVRFLQMPFVMNQMDNMYETFVRDDHIALGASKESSLHKAVQTIKDTKTIKALELYLV